jgi:uncharacterized protein (TIGR02246 family)
MKGANMKADMSKITEAILSLERASNDRWNRGDYYGFLDNYSEDMTYFDPLTEKLLVGRKAVEEHFEHFYKGVAIVRSEYLNEYVTVSDGSDLAVLSYNLRNYVVDEGNGEKCAAAWNSTEVYRLVDGQWRIVHSHWSLTRHPAIVAKRTA